MKFRGSGKEWSAVERKDVKLNASGEIEGLAERTEKELKKRDLQARIDNGTYDPDAAAEAMNPSLIGIEAGFIRRSIAYILDNMIIGLLYYGAFFLLVYMNISFADNYTEEINTLKTYAETREGVVNNSFLIWAAIILSIFPFIYFPLLQGSRKQATFGMRLLGLYISCIDGKPVSYFRAFARHIVFQIVSFLLTAIAVYVFMQGVHFTISLMIIFLNAILIASLPTHQGIHDLAARTLILKR